MNDEIGYIVAVESMTEYRLRRDVSGAGSGATPVSGAGIGSLVRVGRRPDPPVAVIGGMVSAVHEELQPYLPSTMQPRYLPSQEDYSDSYFRLVAVGHLPEEGGADMVDGGGGGIAADLEGSGARRDETAPPALVPSGGAFPVVSVPDLGDPVVPLTDGEIAAFHVRGGDWSMGYLSGLMRQVDPEVVIRLLDRTYEVAVAGGFAGQEGLVPKFTAIRRYAEREVRR